MLANTTVEEYKKYCELLGVEPGADAKKVQESFRARIKKCHPDSTGTESDKKHAQLLIEAYSAFKRGVPLTRQDNARVARAFWKKEGRGRKGSTATREKGYFAGKRMFENIFEEAHSNGNGASGAYNFFRDLGIDIGMEEAVYPENEDTEVWEYSPARTENASSSEEWDGDEQSMERYTRAEMSLRQIVSNFEKQENRFQRRWAREFIGDLAQVQVLYRDLCRFAPHLSYRALRRIRQISELITEIRKAL